MPRPVRTVGLLAWLVASWCALPAAAQGPTRSFHELANRAHGQPSVKLLDTSGTVWSGRVVGVGEDQLLLEGENGTHAFASDQVWEVWNESRGSFRRGFVVGAIVGSGLALVGWGAQGDCSDPTSSCAQNGPVTWSAAAAMTVLCGALGGSIGLLHHDRHMIYLAPVSAMAQARTSVRRTSPGIAAGWSVSF